MVLKRVIPCLDVDAGRVVKGTNFVGLRDAGDPVELAERYDAEGADELVFLDITASHEKRETIVELARRTADNVFIPFTIGGGIRSVEDAQAVLDAGADKVSVNSSALARPELLTELADHFGAQCVVIAIDAKREADGWGVHVNGGRRKIDGREAVAWAKQAVERGAGEVLLTSMDRGGTNDGYDIWLTPGFPFGGSRSGSTKVGGKSGDSLRAKNLVAVQFIGMVTVGVAGDLGRRSDVAGCFDGCDHGRVEAPRGVAEIVDRNAVFASQDRPRAHHFFL